MPSLLIRFSNFLCRDIRSFFPSRKFSDLIEQQTLQTKQVPIPLTQSQELPQPVRLPPPEPRPLILNTSDLIRIQRRRMVLDWRDKSILNILSSGQDALSKFSSYIDFKLQNVSMFGKVFPDKARDILKLEFHSCVYAKVYGEAQRSVDNFYAQVASWECLVNPKPQLAYQFEFSHLSCLADLGFKPSNKDEILILLGEHISGEQGLLGATQKQIADFANHQTHKILS